MKHERPLQRPINLNTEPRHTSEPCFFKTNYNEATSNFLKMTVFLMLLCSFAEQFRRNPLKHNGTYMYQSYNTKVALKFPCTVFVCFTYLKKNGDIFSIEH
jgi:hypothetical protein